MARARTLKPGFFKNEDLASLPYEARLLFAGLWLIADREGRLEDRPIRIKGDLFPYDNIDIDPLLWKLSEFGFIVRYAVGKERYIQVREFLRHQNPHPKEVASVIPEFAVASASKQDLGETLPPHAQGSNRAIPSIPSLSSFPSFNPIPVQLTLNGQPETVSAKPNGKKTTLPKSSSGNELTQHQASWFKLFWDEYWRHVAKQDARSAFDKRIRSQDLFDRIMASLRSQKPAMLAREPERRPHPATWINGERWEDEVETQVTKQTAKLSPMEVERERLRKKQIEGRL